MILLSTSWRCIVGIVPMHTTIINKLNNYLFMLLLQV